MSALIGERWEPPTPSLNKTTEELTVHPKVLRGAHPIEQQTMHDAGLEAFSNSSPESHTVVHHIATLNINATYLITSPYTDLTNQLNLATLDPYTALFALALTFLAPSRPDYATASYASAFNWPTVFSALRDLCHRHSLPWQRHEFHAVIFRSKRRRDFDPDLITQLDRESHREACESGGLLKYWFGSVDGEMRNLATCLWRTREDAVAGGRGPWHCRARAAAREIYESIEFQTHRLVVDAGAHEWRFEEYRE
ncbi:hypothetical protein LTR53_003775 [Teratosphaeriaceae sp. CCFEE 6253]|nr:hypothetical protein LTR53_003775 [Teratosphaeriaceae sp. CCFEE 6253]